MPRTRELKLPPKPTVQHVTRGLVGDVMNALKSMVMLPDHIKSPAWLIDNPPFPATDVLPMQNALVHLPGFVKGRQGSIIEPTPDFFCTYALDFDFDVVSPTPHRWLAFLASVWPGDQASIDCLQEYLGYLLTPDTRQQKIGLFIGPKRSGRGTIGRLIQSLVGRENVAAPTLNSLATNFGMAPLIDKPVAIIGDARLSKQSDSGAIVERLLGISGEDTQTIDRKHLPAWTGKLPTRLMVISNELPRLRDDSEALVSRYLLFRFQESFIGSEDLKLDDDLKAELPGILLWAIKGWACLRERGHFVQPAAGQTLIEELRNLSSPVGAFVRDRCFLGQTAAVDVAVLFGEWEEWCGATKNHSGNEQTFGRNLRAFIPRLETKKRRGMSEAGEKSWVRYYQGVALKSVDDDPAE
jgi:putative DNA primase/helicase